MTKDRLDKDDFYLYTDFERPIPIQAIAISQESFEQLGCITCGSANGRILQEKGNSKLYACTQCDARFVVLINGAQNSGIKIGQTYPTLTQHPRRETP